MAIPVSIPAVESVSIESHQYDGHKGVKITVRYKSMLERISKQDYPVPEKFELDLVPCDQGERGLPVAVNDYEAKGLILDFSETTDWIATDGDDDAAEEFAAGGLKALDDMVRTAIYHKRFTLARRLTDIASDACEDLRRQIKQAEADSGVIVSTDP